MRSGREDPEVVELDIQFAGLAVTVRGPPTTAASFVQQVASGNHGPTSSAPSTLAPTSSVATEIQRAFSSEGATRILQGKTYLRLHGGDSLLC